MPYTTFADLIDHCLAYAGKGADRSSSADYRRAVLAAYQDLATISTWSYAWGLTRLTMSAAYSTGTIAYLHTGGANERQVTLTGGTWPSWAAYGYLVISNVPYEIDRRISNSIVTLTAISNPGADIAALTTYKIFRDTYQMPADFVSGDEVVINEIGTVMSYEHPRSWSSGRRIDTGPGRPFLYTYTGDPDAPSQGRMVMRVWPSPDAAYAIDVLYKKRPREMVFDQVTDGSISVSAAGTTVTGVGTNFNANHVGSVIRFSPDVVSVPTGKWGNFPFAIERQVYSVASAISLELDSAADVAYSGVKYNISDPADIDPDVHSTLLFRLIEKHFRLVARMKALANEDGDLQVALVSALETDSRFTGRLAALRQQATRSGLRHHPITFN